MNASGALAALLGDFDVAAFGDRIGAGMVQEVRGELPELGIIPDRVLVDVLGAAAMKGAQGLINAVELRLRVGGPEEDPALRALETTINRVRQALAQLTTPAELPTEVREAATLQALNLLASMVTSWDESELGRTLPPPPEEPTR